jgi:hypothetical protein
VVQQILFCCDLLELFRLRCIHLWVSIAGVRDATKLETVFVSRRV